MGSDRESLSRFRWTAGRAYLHSLDARKEVAWFVEIIRLSLVRLSVLRKMLHYPVSERAQDSDEF